MTTGKIIRSIWNTAIRLKGTIVDFSRRYLVKPGKKLDLSKIDPSDKADYSRKKAARELEKLQVRMADLQYRLFAEDKQSLLIVLQAMDAGGKDGTIRHVMGPINPQGCEVTNFRAPSSEELDHDFLWRVHKAMPGRGMIGIFNRSHYEDVLVVRVHDWVPKKVWTRRFKQINDFEAILAENGTRIIKFYLHISKEEQLERFQERLDNPDKHWKANPKDFEERKLWQDYMKAFEDALAKCSTRHAPWYVIPANRKWYRNLVISSIIVETLERMKPRFPKPEFDVSKIKIE